MTLRKKENVSVVEQKSVAQIGGMPLAHMVAARNVENESEREVRQEVAEIGPEAIGTSLAEDDGHGCRKNSSEMGMLHALPGVGEAKWTAMRTTSSTRNGNPEKMLECMEVDEPSSCATQHMLKFGRMAKNSVQGVKRMSALEEDSKEFEIAGNTVVIGTSTSKSAGDGGENAEGIAFDSRNLAERSVGSRTKSKKNKSKKNKCGANSRSPNSKKDISQWYCAMCRVQCNSDAPFQNHLKSTKHTKILRRRTVPNDEQICIRRSLSLPLLENKRKNSPVASRRTPKDIEARLLAAAASSPRLHSADQVNPFVVIICNVCKLPCSGNENYTAHMRGQQHAECLKELQKQQN